MHTRFFGLAVDPFGKREMDLLTREDFGLVRFFEAIPHKICTYVGVGYVCHPRCSPKRHRTARRHGSIFYSLFFLSLLFLALLTGMMVAHLTPMNRIGLDLISPHYSIIRDNHLGLHFLGPSFRPICFALPAAH